MTLGTCRAVKVGGSKGAPEGECSELGRQRGAQLLELIFYTIGLQYSRKSREAAVMVFFHFPGEVSTCVELAVGYNKYRLLWACSALSQCTMATTYRALMANVPVTYAWSHSKFLLGAFVDHRSLFVHFCSRYVQLTQRRRKLFLKYFVYSSYPALSCDPGLLRSLYTRLSREKDSSDIQLFGYAQGTY